MAFHLRKIYRNIWLVYLTAICCLPLFLASCGKSQPQQAPADTSLRRALYIQNLYNLHPREEIVPEMKAIIDSMAHDSKDPYYFASLNILIDKLFADGHYSEADTLAVRMHNEAQIQNDSLSIAISKRVRAQMLLKLFQPQRAFKTLSQSLKYIPENTKTGKEFATSTNIREWLWIIAGSLNDTAAMNKYGEEYARLVDANLSKIKKSDTIGHYPVTAASFRSEIAFSNGDLKMASAILDSATSHIRPTIPARAYEHFYNIRCRIHTARGEWNEALKDIDTLLSTHKSFPWFYLNDLLIKAEVLNKAGRNSESAKYYSRYIAYHDSLLSRITDTRLHDLTVLFQNEIDREQQHSQKIRLWGLSSVIILLIILLGIAVAYTRRERKRNRILVARLQEMDRHSEAAPASQTKTENEELSVIEHIDAYITQEKPFTNPAFGRKDIADKLGVSPESVGQTIKMERGCTVKAYINSYRLEEARHILDSDHEISIADLAVKLGFGTPRTLQRAFKDRYDMSPSQYREASNHIQQSNS